MDHSSDPVGHFFCLRFSLALSQSNTALAVAIVWTSSIIFSSVFVCESNSLDYTSSLQRWLKCTLPCQIHPTVPHSKRAHLWSHFNNGSLITLKYSNYFRNWGWEFCILDLYLQWMNLPPLHSSHTYTNCHIVYEASLLVFVCQFYFCTTASRTDHSTLFTQGTKLLFFLTVTGVFVCSYLI